MWSLKLRPYVGASQFDCEPFEEWWPRVRERLPHVPDNVAEHWVYRNFNDTPYAFLPLERLRFELQSWSIVQLDGVRFGSDWGNAASLDRLDHVDPDDPLASTMIQAGTWPEPILVLDNPSGLKERGGESMARWHLIEGHLRLTYLRCLVHRGTANPRHDVWVVTQVDEKSSENRLSNPRGNVSAGYILQKLAGAVEALGLGEGAIKQRLRHACRGQLLHLSAESFPAEKRELWGELMDAISRRGNLEASIESMSVREAVHHARTILELWEWNCTKRGGEAARRESRTR